MSNVKLWKAETPIENTSKEVNTSKRVPSQIIITQTLPNPCEAYYYASSWKLEYWDVHKNGYIKKYSVVPNEKLARRKLHSSPIVQKLVIIP